MFSEENKYSRIKFEARNVAGSSKEKQSKQYGIVLSFKVRLSFFYDSINWIDKQTLKRHSVVLKKKFKLCIETC